METSPDPEETDKEEGPQTRTYNAAFFFKASQRHINPTDPEVAKLIKSEINLAITELESLVRAHELKLITGGEPISASPVDQAGQPIAIAQGTSLDVRAVTEGEIIADTGE